MWGSLSNVCLVALLTALTEAFPNGAPPFACSHTNIPHGSPEPGDSPVMITAAADATYQPGKPQDVVIFLNSTKTPARASPEYGFLLTALDSKGTILSNALASGDAKSVQVKQCAGQGPNSYATHVESGPSKTWVVKFTPPADAQGDIELKATVVDANGDGSPAGDKVYTSSVLLSRSQQVGAPSPAPAATGPQPAGTNSSSAGAPITNTTPPTTDNTPPPMVVNSPTNNQDMQDVSSNTNQGNPSTNGVPVDGTGAGPSPAGSNELDMNPADTQDTASGAPLEIMGDQPSETMPVGAPAGETMADVQPTPTQAPINKQPMTTDAAMQSQVEETSAQPSTTQEAGEEQMETKTEKPKPTKTPSKYGKDGNDEEEYNKKGYDKKGYNREGYDVEGYNKEGYNEDGYDREGYNEAGYNKKGYDRDGYNEEGYDKKGYDRDGYNEKGFDKSGCNREGFCKDRRRRRSRF
eukprot:comp26876_c0_seq1/m.47123 comp26876_c0_seq1/g.47123  ORF comp26876_c0_seq1/g.47123 comp26876_c0_seq1/m.47123 type:complete len:466 (-) comp26876_c0_seq1:546-1943(-)